MPRKPKLPDGLWDRDGVYYARFTAQGRRVRKRLSADLRVACELLRDLRARADRADFNIIDNDYSWDTLKAEFVKWTKQAIRRPGEYKADLERFEKFAALKNVRQISQEVVFGYRAHRLEAGVTARTINREVGTIHNMFAKGVEWGRIGSNPLAGLKPLRHDSLAKNRRALTVEEVTALFDESPEYLKPVWRMFMVTGLRRGELVGLRFSDVDFERKTVTVRASAAKSHREREIPLDDTVLGLLRELRDAAKRRCPIEGSTPKMTAQQAAAFTTDHVFVTQANTPLRNNLLSRFYAICKRAGIAGAERNGSVDIHSLRVTFTTLTLEHGANPKAVQAILGHSTLALTMSVYAKATERSKRDAVGVLPFATITAPAHVITRPVAHTVGTSNFSAAQA